MRLAGTVIGVEPFAHWHSLIARSDVAAVDLAGAERWQQLVFSASADACFLVKQQQSAEPQQDCESLDTTSPVRFVTSFESAQIDCA